MGIPELPFGVREVIAHWVLKQHTIHLLAAERVAELQLDHARSTNRLDRGEYESVRPALESRAADTALFTVASDPEAHIAELLAGFVLLLGYSLGYGEAAHARAARTAR